MPSKSRILAVKKIEMLGANMKRITLSGEGLLDFPQGQEGSYVKASFEKNIDSPIDSMAENRFCRRSFTVRHFRKKDLELDLDFLLHGESGPASKWAISAKEEDTLEIAGPGPAKIAPPEANWYVFVGDMTALPAIAVNLEKLRNDATGIALIEVMSSKDIQALKKPPGLDIQWIINRSPLKGCSELMDQFFSIKWCSRNPYAWVAGEFELMRGAKKFLKEKRNLPKNSMYLSCYWKIDEDNEGMKKAKALFEHNQSINT